MLRVLHSFHAKTMQKTRQVTPNLLNGTFLVAFQFTETMNECALALSLGMSGASRHPDHITHSPFMENIKDHPAVALGGWLKAARQERGIVKRIFAGEIQLTPSQYSELE